MSRAVKAAHDRKFPTRISQEDLKTETMNYLASKGANGHFQAAFYAHTSGEVVGSSNPKFVTLQPTVRGTVEDEAWVQAFEFLYNFLETKGMALTPKAVRVEFGREREPPLGGLFDRVDRDQFFGNLLARAKEPFTQQVESYMTP
jgi:hypothetical protein